MPHRIQFKHLLLHCVDSAFVSMPTAVT